MRFLLSIQQRSFKKRSAALLVAMSALNLLPAFAEPDSPKTTSQETMTEPSLADRNLAAGEKFLAENQQKAGIQKLRSGIQYKIIQQGSGDSPGPTDFVTVNYRGTLIDGTEFDSSYTRNMPATFAVNAVIPGWTEALQLMQPGAKWTVYIPAHLAYGNRGVGRLIGPNATLVFDIELISVKTQDLVGFPDEYDDDEG